MENNNTFVPTFLLTVCSRKNCGNVWTGIRRLAERQVSTATKTSLGTATKEQRLPLLDLNCFTEEPAVLIGTLTNEDDDGSENVAKKMNLRSFKLNRVYLDPLNMSNADDFSWSWILEDFI